MDSKQGGWKSLQNINCPLNSIVFSSPTSTTTTCRSRSLPNICIPIQAEQDIVASSDRGSGNPKKSHNKQKILKKTWDKVKTAIIQSTSSHSYRRGSLKKSESNKPLLPSTNTNPTSSAPSTPLQKNATFDFDSRLSPTDRDVLCGSSLSNSNSTTNEFVPKSTTPKSSSPVPGSQVALATSSMSKSPSGHNYDNEVVESHPQHRDIETEETEKIQRNYAQLQKRLSEELHERMNEYKQDPKHVTENLSEEFKKRLQQWEMWRLSTGKVTYTDEELQQLLPEDFSRKLQEWQCIKTSGVSPIHGGHSKTPDSNTRGTSSPEVQPTKNKLLRKKKSESSRQKELAWLEKQLEKIEGEKKRLEREMKKYVEREARLEKMKEALQNTPNDVWIKTPTAKCKVEKVTEKFTMKLFEWEEKQGIEPESSTMALLHPKYYASLPDQDEDEEEVRARSEFNSTRYDDDTPAFSSPRDSESRHDECDGGGDCCGGEEEAEEQPEIGVEHNIQQELDRLDCHEEDRRPSSASSSDFEEVTDSFATHDKGNSGASNTTDSDFFRAEYPRRRSSEAISTPLSARSPSLSAFTSDDEGEMCGLLKTVSEENENSHTLREHENSVRDAESQTEVVLKAKQIVVEDSDDNDEAIGDDSQQQGVFVQTKRTIFTPILDEDKEKVILIERELDLKSPGLIKTVLQQTGDNRSDLQPLDIQTNQQRDETSPSPTFPAFSNIIFPLIQPSQPQSTGWSSNPPSPNLRMPLTKPPPPRIVDVTPKIGGGSTSQNPIPQRAFPKMGKIPVWCSPLGTRRHLGAIPPVSASSACVRDLNDHTSRQHSTSIDFTIDRFLQDSNLLEMQNRHDHQNLVGSKIPTVTSRIGRRNTAAGAVPEESGIVGAGIQTGQRHPAFLPVRSSSFRFRRESEQDLTLRPQQKEEGAKKGFYAHLKNRVGSVVTKSQSTGSIKSKLGKAFSNLTHKITGESAPSPSAPNPTPAESSQIPSTSGNNPPGESDKSESMQKSPES